jgi:2-keto-4-pentenoate hydratase
VATVANTLASIGKTLRAGDVIITGSVTPPISVGEGSDFTFHLEPFAPISVEIS